MNSLRNLHHQSHQHIIILSIMSIITIRNTKTLLRTEETHNVSLELLHEEHRVHCCGGSSLRVIQLLVVVVQLVSNKFRSSHRCNQEDINSNIKLARCLLPGQGVC